MTRIILAALLLGFGTSFWTRSAEADLISIGLQANGVNNGAITTVGSGHGTAGGFALDYGDFLFSVALAGTTGGAGGLPARLGSASFNAVAREAGTLHIWVSAQGLSSAAGPGAIISSFTAAILAESGGSVTEQTFYSARNGRYATDMLLSSMSFSTSGSATDSASVDFTTAPFSLTQEYTITLKGQAITYDTIGTSYSTVPEPGAFYLLGTALLGFALIGWNRRRA